MRCLFVFSLLCLFADVSAQKIDTAFYKNGKPQQIQQYDGWRVIRTRSYFQDGQLKSIEHFGNFNSCGVSVGTDSFYYRSGKLQRVQIYHNRQSKNSEGCHATQIVIDTKEFYEHGKLSKIGFQQTCYECTSCDCGEWIFYDEKGKLIKKEKHENCYDEQLDCGH